MTTFHQPALYFFGAILLMLGLDYYFPLTQLLYGLPRVVGTVFFAGGALVAAFAIGQFRKVDTPTDPHGRATRLVTGGPYAYSRNPIYLGMVLILIGLALRLGSFSPWLVIPVFGWVLVHYFIAKEEARLAEQFGADYEAYRARVRRWL